MHRGNAAQPDIIPKPRANCLERATSREQSECKRRASGASAPARAERVAAADHLAPRGARLWRAQPKQPKAKSESPRQKRSPRAARGRDEQSESHRAQAGQRLPSRARAGQRCAGKCSPLRAQAVAGWAVARPSKARARDLGARLPAANGRRRQELSRGAIFYIITLARGFSRKR